jgi:hypothetical protein
VSTAPCGLTSWERSGPLDEIVLEGPEDEDPARARVAAPRLIPRLKAGHFRLIHETPVPPKTKSLILPGTDLKLSWSSSTVTLVRPGRPPGAAYNDGFDILIGCEMLKVP